MMCLRVWTKNFRHGRAIKNILAMVSLEVQGHRLTLGGDRIAFIFFKERKDLYLNSHFHESEKYKSWDV